MASVVTMFVLGLLMPFGWIVAGVGLVLAVLFLLGFGRRSARDTDVADRRI